MKPLASTIALYLMLGLMLALTPLSRAPAQAEAREHKVAIHVDDRDSNRMNMALNNAQNIRKYYAAKGEKVTIEIVAYGPGLHMLRADTSPVKGRIAAMSLADPDLRFSACGNTHRKMSKKAGKQVTLVAEAKKVPSGVVRLMELQEQGWSYIRP